MITYALLITAFLFGGMALYSLAFAAFASFSSDAISAALMMFISLTTVFARQILMPMINTATDAKQKQRFNVLHGASVPLTLIHIGVAGYVVVRLANV